MIQFFKKGGSLFYAVETDHHLSQDEKEKLTWAFSGATPLKASSVDGTFVGPRREMITPWSTNAVEIAQNMGLTGITRIEQFTRVPEGEEPRYDKMLMRLYTRLNQRVFTLDRKPEPIVRIKDIHTYNASEGLALSPDEEAYLERPGKEVATTPHRLARYSASRR